MPKDKKAEQIAKVHKDRILKIDSHIPTVLRAMFEKDLAIFDVNYVERRLREVLEKAVYEQEFSDPEINALRKKLLERHLELVKAGLAKPKEWKKNTKDLTEIRDAKAEPVVYEILNLLLNGELIFDEEYLNLALAEQNSDMFKLCAFGYVQTIFSQLEFHLGESMRRANAILWNGKSRENVSFRDVDTVLKSEKKIPDEK